MIINVDLFCETTGLKDSDGIFITTPVEVHYDYQPEERMDGHVFVRESIAVDGVEALELTGKTKEQVEAWMERQMEGLEILCWQHLRDEQEREKSYLEALEEEAAEANYECRKAYL